MFILTPIVGVCNCSMFCCTLLYVASSFAIILIGKRMLVALLCLSPWCLVIVVWLFLPVPWVCLQFVIVVLPDHTHLLFGKGGVFVDLWPAFAWICLIIRHFLFCFFISTAYYLPFVAAQTCKSCNNFFYRISQS